MPRCLAVLAFACLLPAQQPPALRCQVVDAAGVPQPGLRVIGTLHVAGAEPWRMEATTAGDDAIATFQPFAADVGQKGTVELAVAMLGATPRKVVDLAGADGEPVRIA